MTESKSLIEPQKINPKIIGLRPDVDTRNSLQRFLDNDRVKRLGGVTSSPKSLNEAEITDLERIETGLLTLDKLKKYTHDDALYWEFWKGSSRYYSKRARQARQVNSWLEKQDYKSAAKYFLERAKTEYVHALEVAEGGVLETKNFRDEIVLQRGSTRRFLADNFVAYLKTAAVLAKETRITK